MLDFSGVGEKDERLYYSKYYQHIAIRGRLRALDDNDYSEVCRNLYDIIRIFIKHKKSGNGHMDFRT